MVAPTKILKVATSLYTKGRINYSHKRRAVTLYKKFDQRRSDLKRLRVLLRKLKSQHARKGLKTKIIKLKAQQKRTMTYLQKLYVEILKIVNPPPQPPQPPKPNLKEEVYAKLRATRTFVPKFDLWAQPPVGRIDTVNGKPFGRTIRGYKAPDGSHIPGSDYGEQVVLPHVFQKLKDDKYFEYVHRDMSFEGGSEIIKIFTDNAFKDPNVLMVSVKVLYLLAITVGKGEDKRTVYIFNYGRANKFKRGEDNHQLTTGSDESYSEVFFIGYRAIITLKPNRKLNDQTIYDLKAFSPSNNKRYHALTDGSTGLYKLCIYEALLHIAGLRSLKYLRQTPQQKTATRKMLKDEGPEIEEAVMTGQLVKAVELLSKKYDKEIIIVPYVDRIIKDDKGKVIMEDVIVVNRGETKIVKYQELENYENRLVMLYHKNLHVAPAYLDKCLISLAKTEKMAEGLKRLNKKSYCLRPSNFDRFETSRSKDIKGILGYDMETFCLKDGTCVPYNVTIVGELAGKPVKESFYGIGCEKDFIDYVLAIRTQMNTSVTRAKSKIGKIFIFGFNNSKFDNLLCFDKFQTEVPYIRIQFANNAIKFMRFDNVNIYDISLFYSCGSLRETCKAFKLEEEKGVFPYSFVTQDNLDYIGEIPDVEYWNNEKEFAEYCGKHKDFNMKEYTEKYCLLDSKLVYELAKIHIKNCRGEIAGKKFDVLNAPTCANMCLRMFQQVFLKETLYQSPDGIVVKERLAYKGGHTEEFIRHFARHPTNRLYYYDINSSYPASMCLEMPFKYIRTIAYEDYMVSEGELVDQYLYRAKSHYIGTDRRIIPNLKIRTKKGNLKSAKNTPYAYHWGVELKQAIRNGFEIHINEVNEYEKKLVLKEYAEYFYAERLKVKGVNDCLAQFYKSLLNNLSGKFGQRKFDKTVYCDPADLWKHVNGETQIITDWEVINDKLMVQYKEAGEEYDSIGNLVRFISFITAASRSKLSEMMRRVGFEHIYYCDTDSIFTDVKAPEEFVDPHKLGAWKLEDVCVTATFIAKKVYTYEREVPDKKGVATVTKCKGAKHDLMEPVDYEDMNTGKVANVELDMKMFMRSFEGVKIVDGSRTIQPVHTNRIWVGNYSEANESIDVDRE